MSKRSRLLEGRWHLLKCLLNEHEHLVHIHRIQIRETETDMQIIAHPNLSAGEYVEGVEGVDTGIFWSSLAS